MRDALRRIVKEETRERDEWEDDVIGPEIGDGWVRLGGIVRSNTVEALERRGLVEARLEAPLFYRWRVRLTERGREVAGG